jgi:hypothetical protein
MPSLKDMNQNHLSIMQNKKFTLIKGLLERDLEQSQRSGVQTVEEGEPREGDEEDGETG